MYKCNDMAKEIANELGFIPEVNFIEAMQKGGYVYIRPTCGKPYEFIALKHNAVAAGFTCGPIENGFPSFYRRSIKTKRIIKNVEIAQAIYDFINSDTKNEYKDVTFEQILSDIDIGRTPEEENTPTDESIIQTCIDNSIPAYELLP